MKTKPSILIGLVLMLSVSFPSLLLAQSTSEEDIEAACIAQAEDKGIADDKFDDYVSRCIEKAMQKK